MEENDSYNNMDDYKTYSNKAYRFLSFEGLEKTIQNKSLRFTKVTKLNDPLDCSPILYPKKDISLEYYEFCSPMLKHMAEPLFVCCFCKEYDSQDSYLMWSHYAKSHSQVAFEIDFSVHNIVENPSEVTYPESLVNERDKLTEEQKNKVGLFMVTNKLKQWSYEKEVRLVIDKTHHKFNELNAIVDENYIYINIDLRCISKIIFGVNSDANKESNIINLFSDSQYKPIFEKMYIDPTDLLLKSKLYQKHNN